MRRTSFTREVKSDSRMLPLDIIRKDLSLKMSVSSSTVVTRLHLLVLVDVGMLIDVFQPFQISQLFMDHH